MTAVEFTARGLRFGQGQLDPLAAFVRASFELEGVAYVGMWFALAVPVGWLLGGVVALADAVRPSDAPTHPADSY